MIATVRHFSEILYKKPERSLSRLIEEASREKSNLNSLMNFKSSADKLIWKFQLKGQLFLEEFLMASKPT